MKKFLLLSSAVAGVTIIVGILFVYGVFDFNDGKSQLIGSLYASASAELNLHNRIVDNVHGIGILTGEANKTMQSFEEGADFAPFASIVDTVASNRDALNSIFEKNSLNKGQKRIVEGYEEIYRPALENWLTACKKMIPKETKPVEGEEITSEIIQPTAEEMQQFKDELNAVQKMYVGAHNEFVDILNKERQY